MTKECCDRCEKPKPLHAVTITYPGAPTGTRKQLCEDCIEILVRSLDKRKVTRKPKTETDAGK